jgi:hypothetical protein
MAIDASGSQWIDQLAVALGVSPLDGSEANRILSAARDVAHTVERKITPLSTFLVGEAVGRRIGAGAERDEALAWALRLVSSALPPSDDDAGPAG